MTTHASHSDHAAGLADRAVELLDPGEILDLARTLVATPSPAGDEGPLAEVVAGWLRARTSAPITVQEVPSGREHPGATGAAARSTNVLVGIPSGPALALYGHLDTSLAGDPAVDGSLAALDRPPPPPSVAGGMLWGHGAGVAKAPTAAALVATVALQRALDDDGTRVGALVAAGGTHRARPPWPDPLGPGLDRPMGTGVRAALDGGFRPGAVVVAKGGAPGPLHEEPGVAYLAVTLTGRYRPALVDPFDPELTGTAVDLLPVVAAVQRWRQAHLAAMAQAAGDRQVTADVVLGALSVGTPAKPDVHPDQGRLHLHVTTVPGEAPTEGKALAGSLLSHLRTDRELGARGLAGALAVTCYGELPAGRTDPSHPLAVSARAAWTTVRGEPVPDVRGWRGSTDGALLRALGIPTVRVGPPLHAHPDDPRLEGVRLDDLLDAARIWVHTAARYLAPGDPT